jgi:hypothetical protein
MEEAEEKKENSEVRQKQEEYKMRCLQNNPKHQGIILMIKCI